MNQGVGMEKFFAVTILVGFFLALIGYFAPLWVLQIFTVIFLLPCFWFVLGSAMDKPQTLPFVIPLTALFLMFLLGPMWLVYFLIR